MSAYNFDEKIFATDEIDEEEFFKMQSKIWKKAYQTKMDKLFQLRVGNRTNANSVPMPRMTLAAYINDPEILDCYIKIEEWKRKGNQCTKDELRDNWIPPIIIHGLNTRN